METRTSARMGAAIVFADGHFALKRPIQDSFAIIVPEGSMKGQKVGVDPVGEHYAAASSKLSPGVIPDLQPYQYRKLVLEAPDATAGADLGRDIFTVLPNYKSGTVIKAGSEGTAIAKGSLQTSDGIPVALEAGTFDALNNPRQKSLTFFTNREGSPRTEQAMSRAKKSRPAIRGQHWSEKRTCWKGGSWFNT